MSKYISSSDTAKLVRKALKESFPDIKFSVRSDRNSINVNWTDGANDAQVSAVVDNFKGGYFDGMIDYAGSNYHYLDGERVSFGSNYIFTRREYSDNALLRAVDYVQRVANDDVKHLITVDNYKNGKLWGVYPHGGGRDAREMITKRLSKISDRIAVSPSETLDRVKFAGDDGYGRGTVGDLSKPEHQRSTSQGYSQIH